MYKLFRFNPTCEMAVANGQVSYMPPIHLKQFEFDLSSIPSFLGDRNDFVLMPETVNNQFIDYLHEFGFELPRFISSVDEFTDNDKINSLCPWGWSPAEHKIFKPFLPFCTDDWFIHPFARWKNEHTNILSRETTYKFINQLNKIDTPKYDLLEIPKMPLKISALEDFKALIDLLSPPILLKTPLSASGRGHFKIRDIHEHAEQNPWIKSKLKQQKLFYAELFLKKILDVSFHYNIESDKITFLGTVFFETDVKGQFIGCYIRNPEKDIFDLNLLSESCEQASDLLYNGLQRLEINKQYQGPLGIDAIFFETKNGLIKLNPCVEINLRHTMGLINLFLRNRVHPEQSGKWGIIKGDSTIHVNKLNKYQLKDGFIYNGKICLTNSRNKNGYFGLLTL